MQQLTRRRAPDRRKRDTRSRPGHPARPRTGVSRIIADLLPPLRANRGKCTRPNSDIVGPFPVAAVVNRLVPFTRVVRNLVLPVTSGLEEAIRRLKEPRVAGLILPVFAAR